MLQKTVGIVLHTLKYNDTSNIVDIYTRENGRASFLVSVPRSREIGGEDGIVPAAFHDRV